jgi:hypothetical protein
VDKWDSYFAVYTQHMSRFRHQRPVMLEIGVSHGGSIDVWQRWLGRGCHIIGIDIEPRCLELTRRGVSIEIGDQSDIAFLEDVARRHGPFDIVLDDGSHFGDQQIVTLDILWPHLKDRGVYLVEDLHTNYWERKRGGLRRPGTFVEYAKRIADDLTAFHSDSDDFAPTDWTTSVASVSFYDSVVALEKAEHGPPTRITAGRPVFEDLYGAPVGERLSQDHWQRIEEMNKPINRLRRAVRSPRKTLTTVRANLRRRIERSSRSTEA